MDPNRLTVDRGLLHHAVTPLWSNKSKKWLAQWFSDNGYTRAYGSNPANWSGLINPFTGKRSYSQTHAVGQRVTSATPDATSAEKKAGYRVFYIVKNPKGVITWHAGNWNVNRRSIAIENLGDYRNYPLRDGDLRVIADFFRPLDKAVGGAMHILLHKEVYATACPARIAEGRGKIINYINNPPKAPAPKPAPKPTPKPTPKPNVTKYQRMTKGEWELVRDAKLYDFNKAKLADMKPVSSFEKGDKLTIVGKAVHKTGSEYYMTDYSFGKADTTGKPAHTNGVNKVDLKEVDDTSVVVVMEEVVVDTTPHTIERVEDPKLKVGETEIAVAGVDEVTRSVYEVTYVDGAETERKLKEKKIVQKMIVEIVKVGVAFSYPLEPTDGEDANSWLTRVVKWVMDKLSKFTFKK